MLGWLKGDGIKSNVRNESKAAVKLWTLLCFRLSSDSPPPSLRRASQQTQGVRSGALRALLAATPNDRDVGRGLPGRGWPVSPCPGEYEKHRSKPRGFREHCSRRGEATRSASSRVGAVSRGALPLLTFLGQTRKVSRGAAWNQGSVAGSQWRNGAVGTRGQMRPAHPTGLQTITSQSIEGIAFNAETPAASLRYCADSRPAKSRSGPR